MKSIHLPVFVYFIFIPGIAFAKPLGLTVNTHNGPITGHPAPNRSAVFEYLGIPYAQPPINHLRFAAPEKLQTKGKSGTLIASSLAPDCPWTYAKTVPYPNATAQEPRVLENFVGANNHTQSEDCLYLNIWSKSSSKVNKPVLVFFHGGST
jgi:cholinesterase